MNIKHRLRDVEIEAVMGITGGEILIMGYAARKIYRFAAFPRQAVTADGSCEG
jgi:hypothetical protein